MANRLYFINNSTNIAVAYDFSRRAQSADNIALGTGTWRGGVASDNRLYFLQFNSNTAVAYDFSGNRQSSDDITLTSASGWLGAIASDNRLYFINDTSNTAVAYDFSGARQSSDDITLTNTVWNGTVASGNRLYFIDFSTTTAVAYDFSGARQSSDDITLGTGTWTGGGSSDNRLYFINNNTNTAVAYDFSGARQSSDDITLGTGDWVGGATTRADALVATTLSIVSGNNQSGTVSTALANPLIVQVNDQNGNPMQGVSVSFATTGGSLSSATATTGSDGRASVTLTLPGTAGSVTVTASVAGISARPTFTATATAVSPPEPAANLVVTISGTTNINQGARTTLTAAVEDGSGNAITTGLEYTWTASRGRFVGSTTGASIVYEANFTDSDNIDVTISCAVRQPANNSPASSGPSLTALTEIGITGQLVNMYMTALGAVGSNRNNILWNSGVGTLDSGSDRQIKSDLSVRQLRWANDINRFIVNGEGGASIGDYFSGNTSQSVYIIFEGGTYVEIPSSNLASGGTGFAQFNVTDSAIRTLLNNLQTTSDLTVGIADAGSIGIPADSGTGTATVTAAAAAVARPVYTAPSAQSVNEGAVYSLNLNRVFSGATRYSLRTGNEAYVGISGSTVSFTAPQVNTDTNINLLVRATNAGGDTDASIQVTIKQVAVLPTWTAPSAQSVNEGTVYRIDLADQSTRATSYALQGTNARYVGISGSVVSFTAPDVTEDTTITINVRLANADGHIDRSFTVLIRYVPETLVATTLVIVSGNNQSAQVGNALANPLVIQVNDQNGDPLASVTVGFSTTGGTLSAPSATTGSNGRASVRLTLPNTAGSVTVTASVAGLTSVRFTATANEVIVGAAVARIVFEPQDVFYINKAFLGEDVSRECIAYIVFDQNVPDLEQSDISVSAVADERNTPYTSDQVPEIVHFEGEGVCYRVRIKVPDEQPRHFDSRTRRYSLDTGVLTVSLAANAVEGGNNAVSNTLRYMTNRRESYGGGDGSTIGTDVGIVAADLRSYYPTDQIVDYGSLARNALQAGIPVVEAQMHEGLVYFTDVRDENNSRLIPFTLGGTLVSDKIIPLNSQFTNARLQDGAGGFGGKNAIIINGKVFYTSSSSGGTQFNAVLRTLLGIQTLDGTILRRAVTSDSLRTDAGLDRFLLSSRSYLSRDSLYIFSRNPITAEGFNFMKIPSSFLGEYINIDKVRREPPTRTKNTFDTADIPRESITPSVPESVQTLWGTQNALPTAQGAISEDRFYFVAVARPAPGGSQSLFVFATTHDLEMLPDEIMPLTHRETAYGMVVDGDDLHVFGPGSNLNAPGQTSRNLYGYKYDLSKHMRPPVRRAVIYPIFINEGESLDLNDYCKGAVAWIWDVGYEKPSYLSLRGSRLTVAPNSITEETAVLVKVKGINYKGATDDDNFKFYTVIRKATAPVWHPNIKTITMKLGEAYDVSQLVDAEMITAVALPPGATLTDKQLTLVTEGGEVTLRAANGSRTTDITFTTRVDGIPDASDYSDIFRYSAEIGGVAIPLDDILPYPETSADLDPVAVNAYRVGNFTVTLKYRNGYYDSDVPGNFWDAHGLNEGGYLASIVVYHENWVQEAWRKNILFSGLILEPRANPDAEIVTLNCVEESYRLQTQVFQDSGVEKYAKGLQQNTPSYEGVYVPERSVLPIVMGSAAGWVAAEKLEVRKERNRSEGVRVADVIYASTSDIRSQGGPLAEEPLLRFKSGFRQIDVRQAIQKICNAAGVYNPDIMISSPRLPKPELQPIRNIQFPVTNTRIQHVPVDWKHDATNNKRYTLLSNPSDQVGDRLVVHDFETATPEVVKTFDKEIKVQEFVSEDFNTFYILVCDAFSQDKSGTPTAKDTYGVVSEYDAAIDGSNIRILRYVRSTDTLSEYVPSAGAHKPQLGIHYYAGYLNQHQLFDWEGIRAETRRSLAIRNGRLFFRYVQGNNFGVATTENGALTTSRISAAKDAYYNHLSFAFDVDASNGYIYFGWTTGAHNRSTLNLQRRASNGAITNLLSRTVSNSEFTLLDADIEDAEVPRGGMFSGVHEMRFYDGTLYFVAQVQRMQKYNDTNDVEAVTRSAQKTAGAVLYAFDVATSTLTDMEMYQFATNAARSLTVNAGKVFYAESPDATYKYKAYNPDDVDTFNVGSNQNLFPDLRGALKSIDPTVSFATKDDEGKRIAITDHGNMYFEGVPYRGVSVPMLSIDNEIHFIVSHGDGDAIQKRNAAASLPENYIWMKFGDKLAYVLETLTPNTPHALLVDIANKTNAIFFMRNGRVVLKDREPLTAKIDGRLTADASVIRLKEANRDFPERGYLMVDKEILRYSRGFRIDRAQAGTRSAAHEDEAVVTYLDNVVHPESFLSSNIVADTNRFYNVVQDSNLTNRQEDKGSIDRYIEKIFNLNLGLGIHQQAWTEDMHKRYLAYLKVIRKLVHVSLKRSNYLNIGDIIGFNYAGVLAYPMRIVSIDHNRETVDVIGRSL